MHNNNENLKAPSALPFVPVSHSLVRTKHKPRTKTKIRSTNFISLRERERIMGVKSRSGDGSPCLSECLLYAAICMVGLPVEVQVKDGSLYSGILHTASFDEGHGIVLKKARKIGKGKHEKSFMIGSLIDTLVVFSVDFVQVVVKDLLLPAEGVVGDVAGTIEDQSYNFDSEREPKPLISSNNYALGTLDHTKEKMSLCGLGNKDAKVDMGIDVQKMLQDPVDNKQEVESRRQDTKKVRELSLAPAVSVQESQVGEDRPQGDATSCHHDEMAHDDHCVTPSNVIPPQVNSVVDTHSAIASRKASKETTCGSAAANPVRPDDRPESIVTNSANYASLDAETNVSSHSTTVSNSRTSSCPSPLTSPNVSFTQNNSSCNPKEFKLNPEAKVFSPMSANSRSLSAAVPTVTNIGYVSNIPLTMPIAAQQSDIEINTFASRSSPAKLVQYDGLVTGHGGVPAQYSQPVIGHATAWQQPVRFSGQYHPVQAGPAYVHPTSQTVMVGRTGQLVYVHPIAQDAIQGSPVFSQGSPYPLLNPCQSNMPKFHGTAAPSLQLCVAPPLVTAATQPFTVPGHIPFSQPFPTVRPILVPGGNGFYGSKFQ